MSGRGGARRALCISLALLATSIALSCVVPIDVALQDRFFDAASGTWILDEDDPVGRWLFYHGPKVAIWIVAVCALALALGPTRWRERWRLDRRGLFLAVLAIASVPALAQAGKRFTNVHCPRDLVRYGGREPYVELCECYSTENPPTRPGRCYPAGHASGGFALLGLIAARRTRRWKVTCAVLALALGWWMGGYQMLRGAHFLSHTVTSMWLACAVVAAWHCAIFPRKFATN